MLKILFIGDISGRLGRKMIAKVLPELKTKHRFDVVIANAENSAHGSGINRDIMRELSDSGIEAFTLGDHAFSRLKDVKACFDHGLPLIRPANYPENVPGQGYLVHESKSGPILIISLAGRVFMDKNLDCPFRAGDKILANFAKQNFSAIIMEVHAEATSEKIALKHHFDGRVSALLGTHTHVMTADSQISPKGTAFISDVGMVGAADGVIGVDKENIIKIFLEQIKYPHVLPEKGRALFNAVILAINQSTGRAVAIKPIVKHVEIK